jgi:hypothetical protein
LDSFHSLCFPEFYLQRYHDKVFLTLCADSCVLDSSPKFVSEADLSDWDFHWSLSLPVADFHVEIARWELACMDFVSANTQSSFSTQPSFVEIERFEVRRDFRGVNLQDNFGHVGASINSNLQACLLDLLASVFKDKSIEFVTGAHDNFDLTSHFVSQGRYFFHELNSEFRESFLADHINSYPLFFQNSFAFDKPKDYVLDSFLDLDLDTRFKRAFSYKMVGTNVYKLVSELQRNSDDITPRNRRVLDGILEHASETARSIVSEFENADTMKFSRSKLLYLLSNFITSAYDNLGRQIK